METIGIPPDKHETDENKEGKPLSAGKSSEVSVELFQKAHLYVIQNTDEIVPYIERQKQVLKTENPGKRIAFLENEHSKSFAKCLRKEVERELAISKRKCIRNCKSWVRDTKDIRIVRASMGKTSLNEYKDNGRFWGSKLGCNESDVKPSWKDIEKAKACMLAKAQASEASSKAKVEACGLKVKVEACRSKVKLLASNKTLIVKSPTPILNCVLGLANGKTWDAIKGKTFRVKIPPTMIFAEVKIGKRNLRKIIEISSDSLKDRKGASKAIAPIFYGPSTQGLLDAYGYNTIEEYLSWNYFPSTDNESTNMETIDKRNTDKDCIVDSNSVMSKGKYVLVCKKHKPNMYSLVPVTGCVLGLANVTTWDEIENKMGARKSKTYAYKVKGKRKVSRGS
ncbi:hypothetical protein Tco_0955915 [Tanacetum coccineum]|uniref:Uncharacterized protein n=1 Tax=Tanacetum coccineum TaxID=301880 RepID=A0ABQ5E8J7_9ASTR